MPDEATRLRLTEVTLRGFKAAYEPPAVPLGMFNLLIGRSGSGKSTLIEALEWIDTGIRRDIRAACDPFRGVTNLIHRRVGSPGAFDISTSFQVGAGIVPLVHRVQIGVVEGAPRLQQDELAAGSGSLKAILDGMTGPPEQLRAGSDRYGNKSPRRAAVPAALRPRRLVTHKLLLDKEHHAHFWHNAVFLRLVPAQLSEPGSLYRKSFEPILDPDGRLLPALLAEVLKDPTSRAALVAALQDILPWARDLEVPRPLQGMDVATSWVLREQFGPDTTPWEIPAWMLSDGTRRLTAILALLYRDPAPSLVCIEEVENGLDPWTVRALLRELQSAADRGVQIIATTHSPWVLDDVPMDCILQARRKEGDVLYERFADRPEVRAYDPSIPAGTRYVNEAE